MVHLLHAPKRQARGMVGFTMHTSESLVVHLAYESGQRSRLAPSSMFGQATWLAALCKLEFLDLCNWPLQSCSVTLQSLPYYERVKLAGSKHVSRPQAGCKHTLPDHVLLACCKHLFAGCCHL